MKAIILALLKQAHEEEMRFLRTRPAHERRAGGSASEWSASEVLCHLAAWKARIAARLAAVARGDPLPPVPDFDEANRALHALHRGLSWQESADKLTRAHARLVAQLHALHEAPLRRVYPGAGLLWQGVVMNGYWHTILHLAPYYTQVGEASYLNDRVEQDLPTLVQLDPAAAWRGKMRYDVACYYALTQQPAAALAYLQRAFQVDPRLAEWSTEDSDLASLHGTPAFRALLDA